MAKRTVQEVRKAILKVLRDNKPHSFGELERKVNTNWQSIRTHCTDLEFFDCVTIKDSKVKITKRGMEILNKVK